MVFLELMYQNCSPAAIIVQDVDSLLISGPVPAEIWFKKGIPMVEYPTKDIYDKISEKDLVEVNGMTGEIMVYG